MSEHPMPSYQGYTLGPQSRPQDWVYMPMTKAVADEYRAWILELIPPGWGDCFLVSDFSQTRFEIQLVGRCSIRLASTAEADGFLSLL